MHSRKAVRPLRREAHAHVGHWESAFWGYVVQRPRSPIGRLLRAIVVRRVPRDPATYITAPDGSTSAVGHHITILPGAVMHQLCVVQTAIDPTDGGTYAAFHTPKLPRAAQAEMVQWGLTSLTDRDLVEIADDLATATPMPSHHEL